jgi:hypothetical protein
MMHVSLATRAAEPGRHNEDHAVSHDRFAAVLDGVSSPAGMDTGCVHNPAWYVRKLGARLVETHQHNPDGDLREVVAEAIEAVRGDHGDGCDLAHPGSPQATLAVLRRSTDHGDVLVLGDCTVVLDRAGDITTVTDERMLAVAGELRQAAFASTVAIGSSDQADRVQALVLGKRDYHNRPGGYWTAATNPLAAYEAITGRMPLAGPTALTRAALLTDGASCLVDRYRLYDWAGMLDLLGDLGPEHVIDVIRAAEDSDPEAQRWTRLKRHDDATIAYISVSPEAA